MDTALMSGGRDNRTIGRHAPPQTKPGIVWVGLTSGPPVTTFRIGCSLRSVQAVMNSGDVQMRD
jgi:hypothetical protein